MSARRIPVGPVNHPAKLIPLVLPPELNRVPLGDGDPRRQIDVVGNEHGLISHAQNEPLVLRPLKIVGEAPGHHTRRLDLDSGAPRPKGVEDGAGTRISRLVEVDRRDEKADGQEPRDQRSSAHSLRTIVIPA